MLSFDDRVGDKSMVYTVYHWLALVLFGLVLGFLSAIPVGAVQVEVMRLTLRGHRRAGIATAAGSATSDLIYGVLTLFGLAAVLTSHSVQIPFYLTGAAVLGWLLVRAIRDHRLPDEERPTQGPKHHHAFMTGFLLAITNPGMVIWWLVGLRLAVDAGLCPLITVAQRIVFIVSGVGGLFGYLAAISFIVSRINGRFSDRLFAFMHRALIALLSLLVAYFLYRAVRLILG